MNYEFPFDKCLSLDFTRVYIYGAGAIGASFQKQIYNRGGGKITNLGFIDNFVITDTSKEDVIKRVGVYKPEILRNAEYDCIVLACSYKLIPEICECLFKVGVDFKRIVLPEINTSFFTPNIGEKWNEYYEIAERDAPVQVERYFVPLLSKHQICFNRVLDFPSGNGRMAENMYKIYAEQIGKLVCCDANTEAVNYCRKRFADKDVFDYMVNKVDEWECIPFDFRSNEFTFIYSWDAMVHFSYKWLDFYIGEFFRILENNGYVFIHHSNLSSADVKVENGKSDKWFDNLHWRALVSARDVKYISEKHGFKVVEQNMIDWGVPKLDCITLLQK